MVKVIIGFSRAKSKLMVLSTLIEKVSKRPFSHVYVRFADPIIGRQMTFEASLGIVHFGTFEGLKYGNIVAEEWSIEISKLQFFELYNFMLNRLEIPYGFMALMAASIKVLTGIKIRRGDGEQSEICSELGARICKSLGMDIPGDLDYITPADLQKFVSTKLKKEEVDNGN